MKVYLNSLHSLSIFYKISYHKSLPVTIAVGKHPFPFRTRKLSLPALMVLRGFPRGRVSRRRHFFCLPDIKPLSKSIQPISKNYHLFTKKIGGKLSLSERDNAVKKNPKTAKEQNHTKINRYKNKDEIIIYSFISFGGKPYFVKIPFKLTFFSNATYDLTLIV